MAPPTLSLTTAVQNMYCGTILHILENNTDYSKEECSKAVDAFVEEAPGRVYPFIVPHCDKVQLSRALSRSLGKGWWQSVGRVLENGIGDTLQRHDALEEACKKAASSDIENYILPHCREDDLDMVLPHIVKRGLWSLVGKVLERGGNDEQRRDAIQQATDRANDKDFEHHILPHCRDTEIDDTLNRLITRGLWSCVGKLLDRGVCDNQRRFAVEEASKRADGKDFQQYIQHHCNGHIGVILSHLVKRCLWHSVGFLLSQDVSDEQRRFAVEEGSKAADDKEFEQCILPHCSDDTVDLVLKKLVTRGLWLSVGKMLTQGVILGETQQIFVIEEASKRAADTVFRDHILPHCSDDQLSDALKHLLTRGLWSSLKTVLEREAMTEQCRFSAEVSKTIPNDVDFERNILPHSGSHQLDASLPHLALRGFWVSVRRVLEKGQGSVANRLFAIENAIERASDEGIVVDTLLKVCNKEEIAGVVLPGFAKRRKWDLLQKMVIDCVLNEVYKFEDVLIGKHVANRHDNFWLYFHCCHIRTSHQDLAVALARSTSAFTSTTSFGGTLGLDIQDIKVLLQSILFILCCVTTRGLSKKLHVMDIDVVSDIHKVIFNASLFKTAKFSETGDYISNQGNILLEFINHPYPLLPGAFSVILRGLLHYKRWDVLSSTCLSTAWEHVRREVFQAAVEQRQWQAVKHWTDHTLYDSQRWWALEEAYKEQQWEVMLLLADHGLTEIELMRVRYRLAKHADWQVVLQMFERGVDVTEVREVVEMAVKSSKAKRDPAKHGALVQRWKELVEEEKKLTDVLYGKRKTGGTTVQTGCTDSSSRNTAKKRAMKAARLQKWSLVFFHFFRHFDEQCLQHAIGLAVENQSWDVVIQLVRLGMNKARRDSFFVEMLNRRQWSVCRALLDKGLNVQLCLDVLPQLVEMNQWMLVARVMEFTVGDAVRKQVMHQALERREGSVVWRCISTMQQYRLSVEEREKLFQQSFSHSVWQALLPLIEEKDSTGIQHRDKALLAATERHHWDVVDHCQLHKADIDMRDEQGETSLNRAARNKDWIAVEELVARGADPNILDTMKISVLCRATIQEQWSTVELLIKYFADIQMASTHNSDLYNERQRFYRSRKYRWNKLFVPLQELISVHQCEILNHTLMWCSGQSNGLSCIGETVLHAMALGKRPELLYFQVVRGVNPLYRNGIIKSVLLYAVQNQYCRQKMVAECIRLGFSTHQPSFCTRNTYHRNLMYSIFAHLNNLANPSENYPVGHVSSPFLLSVLKGDLVLANMLFEAGSSSNTELYHLYGDVLAVTDPFSYDHKEVVTYYERDDAKGFAMNYHDDKIKMNHPEPGAGRKMIETLEMALPSLKKMATAPRSLKSSCRLVISYSLNVLGRRHRDVQRLPRVDEEMRSYLMFSDLTDPDYSYAPTPRSLATSCRLAIFAWLFFCSRCPKTDEGKNSVPCSLDDLVQTYHKKPKARKATN